MPRKRYRELRNYKLQMGARDLEFRNVVRGFSLVLHNPEGSHYINLELGIWSLFETA